MDKETIKSNYLKVVKAHKLLIKANKDQTPTYFEDFYDDIDNKLNYYKKNGLLYVKYYDLLDSVGKFINKYEIDISIIKTSTIIIINDHCRLRALHKISFSEPEDEMDEIDDEMDEIEDEINDDKDEINDDNDEINDDNDEKNKK